MLNREITAKIYDYDKVFLETLSNYLYSNQLRFTSTINIWFGDMSFDYHNENVTNIRVGNLVELVDEFGTTIYIGEIYAREKLVNSTGTFYNVSCRWLNYLLGKQTYHQPGSPTTFAFSRNTDIGTIINEILTQRNTRFPNLAYDISSIGAVWFTVNVSFDYDTLQSALTKVLATYSRFLRFNGDMSVEYIAYPSTATITFNVGKDVDSLKVSEDITNMYNRIYVEYSSWVVTVDDAGSQAIYGIRDKKEDQSSDIVDSGTATNYGNRQLALLKNPENKTEATINGSYDISTIKPGYCISIGNLNEAILNKVIQRVEYNVNNAKIYLEGYDTIAKTLDLILKR